MPLPEKLPVIVAVRMSLSFPILLSTVPLHAIDYTRPDQPIVRHQFSDGGIGAASPRRSDHRGANCRHFQYLHGGW
jgi:hypothetical protein